MSKGVRIVAGLFAALATVAPAAYAADLNSKLEQFLVKLDDKGLEKFVEAKESEPGDIIEYRLTYSNSGDKAIPGLNVTGPVPAGTAYVAGSGMTGVTADFRVSIDGGKNWENEPVVRTRVKPDGTVEEYVVTADKYTHIRWFLQERLEPAKAMGFKYRVSVKN